ncbi:MAG: class I SAM-dependent methyltransferase [Gemmatimonadota bacterium]
MTSSPDPEGRSYEDVYRDIDAPLNRQLRVDAYGTDIGQHSWVTVEDLRADLVRLRLSAASRLLDLGCGPCGPLLFALGEVRCHGCGADVSRSALEAGRSRAAVAGLESRLTLYAADLNERLPFEHSSFDAAMSLDVILHLRDRLAAFREVARVLKPGGRFLFTDAGIISGTISEEERLRRSSHGQIQLVPPGENELQLGRSGFRLLEHEDRTTSVIRNARGRMLARLSHRLEVEQSEGQAAFDREQSYLETVIALAERGALSRVMYLAERS